MNKSRIFLILSLSFIGGVFGRSFFDIDDSWFYIFAIITVILLSVFWKNKLAVVAAFSFLFLALGIWRTEADLIKLNNLNLNGQTFSGRVIVAKEPEGKENYLKIIFYPTPSQSPPRAGGEDFNLKIMANAPLHSGINYGDEIKVNYNSKFT